MSSRSPTLPDQKNTSTRIAAAVFADSSPSISSSWAAAPPTPRVRSRAVIREGLDGLGCRFTHGAFLQGYDINIHGVLKIVSREAVEASAEPVPLGRAARRSIVPVTDPAQATVRPLREMAPAT